ncbi:aspartyl protease family protein [Cesiribacter sp. SM1]|uniref:aspartyl protease family protein n=1 Tax=Cesiribacter sp. SM1 TaxID=2861196 RepID=UPI001CD38981|nr:aspartyl protease family protein [Cesiribacter sp. SM1]
MAKLAIYWNKQIRILLAIALLVGLQLLPVAVYKAGAQIQSINFLDSKASVQIPFRNINNLILIPVLLDNMIPLEFLLDTGVRTPILTDRVYSDILNINYDRSLSLRGAGYGTDVQAYVASNVRMMLPNVQVSNLPILVLEEDYLELGSQLGVPVHGIIGYELFARFVVKIDYGSNMITLYEPEHFKAPRSYERFDLMLENTKPFIHAEVTDKLGKKHTLKLLIDTGASHALLLHSDRAEVPLPEKTLYGNLGRGLLGDIEGHIGRLPELNIAEYTFHDVLSSFPNAESYSLTNHEQERDGTLGGDVLSRFTVILDYPHKAVYLDKGNNYKRPFIFNRSGLTISARGKALDSLVVTEIRKDSPAAKAGILKKDIIFKINGMRTQGAGLPMVADFMRKREGKKLRVVILRNGKKLRTHFRLRDAI